MNKPCTMGSIPKSKVVALAVLLVCSAFGAQAQWTTSGTNTTTTNNVGIGGATSPTAKLQVTGNLTVTKKIYGDSLFIKNKFANLGFLSSTYNAQYTKTNYRFDMDGPDNSIFTTFYDTRFRRKAGFNSRFVWENETNELMSLDGNGTSGKLRMVGSAGEIESPIIRATDLYVGGIKRDLGFITKTASNNWRLDLDVNGVSAVYSDNNALRFFRDRGTLATSFVWETKVAGLSTNLMTLDTNTGNLNVTGTVTATGFNFPGNSFITPKVRMDSLFEKGVYRPLGFIGKTGAEYKLSLGSGTSVYAGNNGLRFRRDTGLNAKMVWENQTSELMTLDANTGNLTLGGSLTASSMTLNANLTVLGLNNATTSAANKMLVGFGNVDPQLTMARNATSKKIELFTAKNGVVGDDILLQPTAGRVGIGTVAPAYTLDVKGDINATAIKMAGQNLRDIFEEKGPTQAWQSVTDANGVQSVSTTRITSVGILLPGESLDIPSDVSPIKPPFNVLGNSMVTGNIFFGSNGAALTKDQGGSIELGGGSLTKPGKGASYIDFHYLGKSQDYNTRIVNDADGELSLAAANKVKISNNLTVGGSMTVNANLTVMGLNNATTSAANKMLVGFGTVDPSLTIARNATSKKIEVFTTKNGVAGDDILLQPTVGNVGINTSAPAFPLDVNGIIRCTGFTGPSVSLSQSNNPSKLYMGASLKPNTYEINTSLGIGGPSVVALQPFGGRLAIGTTDAHPNALLTVDGQVHISRKGGLNNTQWATKYDTAYLLWVEKGIVTNDFALAEPKEWMDKVFEADYNLPSLAAVEQHIKEKGYLHTMLSEKEITEKGYSLHDMNKRMVQTIEELTLHAIEQEKKITSQEDLIKQMMARLQALEGKNK
jgi:hypothetical protein